MYSMQTVCFYCHLVWSVWCFLQGNLTIGRIHRNHSRRIFSCVTLRCHCYISHLVFFVFPCYCLLIIYCACTFVARRFAVTADYVKLSHDGPVVLGGTITFRADLYDGDERPQGFFRYTWRDNSLMKHEYQVGIMIIYYL